MRFEDEQPSGLLVGGMEIVMGFRKRVTINLLATWGDHVIGLAVGLILMPLVLGVLGDAQYGMWIFINSIAGYSGL